MIFPPVRSPGWFVAVAALAGLAIRITYILVVNWGDPLSGDGFYYHHAANLLADGLGFIEPYRYLYGGAQEALFLDDPSSLIPTANTALPVGHSEPTAGHPPLWVLVLGAFSTLGFTSVGSHLLIGAAIGAAGVVAVGWAGRQLEPVLGLQGIGVTAAALAAIHTSFWLNDGLLMSETLVVPIAALLVGSGLRFGSSPSLSNAILFGLIGGLTALTRAELLLAVPVILMGSLRSAFRRDSAARGPVVRRGLLVLVVSVGILSPWIIRNLLVFEEPVFLSNGTGVLLAQANCYDTYFGDKQGYWEFECALPQPLGATGQPIDESQRDRVYQDRGLRYMSEHRERLLTHTVPKRVARYWGIYAPIQQLRADILVENRNFRLSVVAYAQFAAVAALACAGIATVRRRRGPLFTLVALPLTGTLTAAATFGTTRYRVSAEVALVILSAVVLSAWAQRRALDRSCLPEPSELSSTID